MFYSLDENNNIINPSVAYGDKTSDLSYHTYILAPERFYIYDSEIDEIVVNPNFEQEQAEKELERIAQLNLTGADVERAILKAKGMDFDDIIAYLPTVGIDETTVKIIKVELGANHFFRGNPYVAQIGTLLGFTSKQLDKFFETNDYHYLLPEEVTEWFYGSQI